MIYYTDEIDKKEVESPKYTPAEVSYRGWLIKRLQSSRDQRDTEHVEFDGQTYLEYWESNAKAGNAYIPPKINREDVRVTTGTTLEKKNTLLSSLLNMNMDVDIEAYDDEDREIVELGTVMEDLIKKSRKLEPIDYDIKKMMIYNELLTQGDVVVEDMKIDLKIPQRTLKKMGTKLSEIQWSNRIDKVYTYLSTNIVNMTNVYFGNLREYFIENQPFIFTRRLIPREEARAIYGDWERWENVPYMIDKMIDDGTDSTEFNEWTLEDVQEDKTEEIRFYDKWHDNFMILVNGVMMFPVREENGKFHTVPLSSLTGKSEYPMAKGSLEPITAQFAYSKSMPSKLKVDQQIFDEMYKAIVLKTRKSYQPPMANNTGQMLSRRIFYPANITKGIDPGKLQEIGNNTGVTGPEFNVVQWLKQNIDSKSVAPIMEGQSGAGSQTAREIMAQMQQAKIRIGVAILGVIGLEKRLAKLRLWNILKHWTEPIDYRLEDTKEGIKKTVNKYKTISVDTELDEGVKGQRIVDFTEEEQPHEEQVVAEEELLSKKANKPVRKVYINPKILREMDYHWYVEIIPTEKDTSQLKLAMFEETIQKMIGIFMPAGKTPNFDYLADRWALLAGENPDKLFPPQPEQPQLPPGQEGGMVPGGPPGAPPGPPGQGGPPISNQVSPSAMPSPSVNQMATA